MTEELTGAFMKNQVYLKRLAYRFTDHNEEANDLVQETYLKALNHISHFRGDANLKTWLTKILINTYFSKQRKKNNMFRLNLNELSFQATV